MLLHCFASSELKDSWKKKTYFNAKIIEQYYTEGLIRAGFGYRAVPSSVTTPVSPWKYKASTFDNRIAVLEERCLSIPISNLTHACLLPQGCRRRQRSPSWVHQQRCFPKSTWKQVAESANAFKRLLSLLLMASLSLWDSSFPNTTLKISNENLLVKIKDNVVLLLFLSWNAQFPKSARTNRQEPSASKTTSHYWIMFRYKRCLVAIPPYELKYNLFFFCPMCVTWGNQRTCGYFSH